MSKNFTVRTILIFLTLFVLFGTGCVSKNTGNIATFGTATKGVSDKINDVINEYNEGVIKNEINQIAEAQDIFQIKQYNKLDSILIKQTRKKEYALYKANKALGSYAKALSDLAESGSQDKVKESASKLYGALEGMNEQYKTLTDSDEDLLTKENSSIISRFVAEIGYFYIESIRRKAISEIVPAADPSVQKICDVIKDELLKGAIEGRIYTFRDTEITGYVIEYNKKIRFNSLEKRKAGLNKIYEKYLAMKTSSVSVQAAIKAIGAIKKAHTTMKTELQKGKFASKDILETIGELKDIHDSFDDFEKLMIECETEIIIDDKKGIICKP